MAEQVIMSLHITPWGEIHDMSKKKLWCGMQHEMWLKSHNISTYLEASFWRDSFSNMGSYDIYFC
jgi:hypothetical protein